MDMNNGKGTIPFCPRRVSVLQKRVNSRGQTLVEYALILAFICIVAVGVMISMTKQVNSLYSNIGSSISTAISSH